MMKKQSGFTLIEIVMVLVLLGILTAVAVPKYFDLRSEANERAAATYAAEYQARLNAYFAKELLANPSQACATSRKNAIDAVNLDSDVAVDTTNTDEKDGVVKVTNTSTGLVSVDVWMGGEKYQGKYKVQIPACSDDQVQNNQGGTQGQGGGQNSNG